MLSPKMQRTVRVNDSQLVMLSEKAHDDHSMRGYLHKRTADSARWQLRWFVLYQNLLFYYENEHCSRPNGVVLLEGCYCDRLITANGKHPDKQHEMKVTYEDSQSEMSQATMLKHCFAISYRRENERKYELKAAGELECKTWIDAIRDASFNKLLLQKEKLEQKYLHLLRIVESEKTDKSQYVSRCEDLALEVHKLRIELNAARKKLRASSQCHGASSHGGALFGSGADSSGVSGAGLLGITEGSLEMQKIKKVQSFFRGWLCRRRWKQIVEQYIKSPHAESMRKRNSLVFNMVEAEEDYTRQMEILVSCFLRPFKMAASSKKPPCCHEDVNSIFLNSETLLFLHQIFLKGLTSRMESWPTLVLGDLFDMLLPMLSIYQEYVRNHHYSLQVLTHCKQSSPSFAALLTRLENKPACGGRTLETFLTYPMDHFPKYIVTLNELLAHTPFDHVERKSLENAKQQLEDLSRQMRDEVSETENLRKNLSVERMIVEGCDILLDVNQVFVRQGTLIQILDKPKGARSRFTAPFGGKGGDKEAVRQCFLFSNHLLLTTRQSDDDGRLNLVPQVGKIPLSDAILVEDPSDQGTADDDELSVCSMSSGISESSGSGGENTMNHLQNRDFKIIVDLKLGGPQVVVHLIAATIQEKAAWISDIIQCKDNVYFSDHLFRGSLSDTSSAAMPQSYKNDPSLFKDDVDIRFSRKLNSCKVPHIRSATPERLLQQLTDLRFLSVDFLNTFLLTYRVFTDGVTVLEALKKVFYEAEPPGADLPTGSFESLDVLGTNADTQSQMDDRRRSIVSPRRTSATSSVSGYGSEISEIKSHGSCDFSGGYTVSPKGYNKGGYKKEDEKQQSQHHQQQQQPQEQQQQQQPQQPVISETPSIMKRSPTIQSSAASAGTQSPALPRKNGAQTDQDKKEENDGYHLTIPKVIAVSSSSETLTDNTVVSAPSSPSNLSSVTLVGSTGSGSGSGSSPQDGGTYSRGASEDTDTPVATEESKEEVQFTYEDSEPDTRKAAKQDTPTQTPPTPKTKSVSTITEKELIGQDRDRPMAVESETTGSSTRPQSPEKLPQRFLPHYCQHRASIASAPAATARSGSISTTTGNHWLNRRSIQETEISFQSGCFQHDKVSGKVGVVVTSSRQSHRRISRAKAFTAFAVATSAASNSIDKDFDGSNRSGSYKLKRKESLLSTAATMRVLNVLRHWISKHAQDFETDQKLKSLTIRFLEDIMYCPHLLPAEHKAANQLLRLIIKEEQESSKVDLKKLLAPPTTPSKETIETLSALEIAEQMTYLDHKIFISISNEEFLGQAWMKEDKATRAPNILLMTKRFNEVSQLVVSEIIRRSNMSARVAAIEKWAAVADISRVLHNYNGVLQICAAFRNSSVYRLKKTWEKVPKPTRQTIDKLQNIVSSDGRFKNLRNALHRCDPPCIPYLGLYLTDLSFINEGTPTMTEDGLLNFSKMRMIANVIREIRQFQQTPYKIELITKVTNYLLDPSLLLDDKDLYSMSLEIEPRTSRLSSSTVINLPPSVSNTPTK
ncbi:ras-specific guanine nucleotide-releasing factor 1 isoform X3 [Nomia melanderi]|uniref:ras-specific guanine nucleotide-releasing factor 1 isoform X3 n=1 Tax=Nomia melanderi TaxID=2448451 RepID=UPI001304541B|nr:ras-specific guanine nucleotide-releasing factor 2-like isoform X3 [Nomia melanderi]